MTGKSIMRKHIKSVVLAATAALLLSGCGGYNTPSGTEREKDITSTSEVVREDVTTTEATTTTTEATTVITTVETTTTATLMTVTKRADPEPLSEKDMKLEEDFKRIFRENLLGVWKRREDGSYTVIGINDKYPDSGEWFIGYGHPVLIKENDEKLELYINNYIGDSFVTVIYFDKPDELICTELYDYDSENVLSAHYDRVDTAEMYPETGKLNFFIHTLLMIRGLGIYAPFVDIEYGGKMYSNDNSIPYVPYIDCEYELIEDNGDSLIFSSLFYEKGDEKHTVVKRFRYELHRDGEYWKLGEFEPYEVPEKEKE